MLDSKIKQRHVDKLTMLRKRWTSEQGHIDSPDVFHEFETGQLDRLIEYLQVVDTSHSEGFETSQIT